MGNEPWKTELQKLLDANPELRVDAQTQRALSPLANPPSSQPVAAPGPRSVPRYERPAVTKGQPAPLEHQEQAALVAKVKEYAAYYPQLELLYAIPNGAKLPYTRNKRGQRVSIEAVKLKLEGLQAGVPDLCLPVSAQGYHGLYVEMKRADHSRHATDEQKWWMDRLTREGYRCVVCYGATEAYAAIMAYLGIQVE